MKKYLRIIFEKKNYMINKQDKFEEAKFCINICI